MVNLPLLEQGLIKSMKKKYHNAHVLNLFCYIYAAALQILQILKIVPCPKNHTG